MNKLDLNSPIFIKRASLRFFEKGEYHITRFSEDNVLLLVYDGVLRFTENGVPVEVKSGEYYIQKAGLHQSADRPSSSPKYLYVHFTGNWTDADGLSRSGKFDYAHLSDLIFRIDTAAHRGHLYTELECLFLKLLLSLNDNTQMSTIAKKLSNFIEDNIYKITSLSDICEEFHYSKNYVIRIFKREFGLSPFQYINNVKIERAMYLIETTSRPVGDIATECGYSDYPYFYKRFVEKTGASPVEWRKRHQGE